ncbi:hypothetical protein CL618_03475 [archaeon]|nr:hypothetical protein [archaeon]|tara:strand:- start:281 stop:742 length:462 start_codon:yes stop_codon:yes gene_type:complete
MNNRNVGLLIVGISVLVGFIIYIFNKTLKEIVGETCTHGPSCPMYGTISFQTSISIGIMVFIILIGLYLVFFGDRKKEVKIEKKDYRDIMKDFDEDYKKVFDEIVKEESIFQSELVERTELNKVKVTRILDKLEGKGLIERKRRGMTNVVILK